MPQFSHVGETEQLAETFLFIAKYPADVTIPPRIKSRPVVFIKSFRFIFKKVGRPKPEALTLINFIFCGACFLRFSNYTVKDAPFIPPG